MLQIVINQPKDVAAKTIELLKSPDTHASILFEVNRDSLPEKHVYSAGAFIIVLDDMPNQKEFIKEFYTLCDKYLK